MRTFRLLAVVGVVVALVGCGNEPSKGQDTTDPTVIVSDEHMLASAKELQEAELLNTPLGFDSGYWNITILVSGDHLHIARTMSNGKDVESTKDVVINLSTHTARIRYQNGNVVLATFGEGHHHGTNSTSVAVGSYYDAKMVLGSPFGNPSGGSLASIVGAEDGRNVMSRGGDHQVFTLTAANSSVNVSSPTAGNITFSYSNNTNYSLLLSEDYCILRGEEYISRSGVELWDVDFSIGCEDRYN